MEREAQQGLLRAPKQEGRSWRLRSRGLKGGRKREGRVKSGVGSKDSGNPVSVFQGGGRVGVGDQETLSRRGETRGPGAGDTEVFGVAWRWPDRWLVGG